MIKYSEDAKKQLKELKRTPQYWIQCILFRIKIILWKLFNYIRN